MSKKIDVNNWEEYDDDQTLSYSYLKKKGKHKSAKTDIELDKFRRGIKPAK
jgi:hypothetical protein